MGSMIEATNKRVSVRTYIDQPIEKEKRDEIIRLLHSNEEGPFGNRVRFELIDLSEMEKKEMKALGTYGFISGASFYIASALKGSKRGMEDVGYCFEKIILEVTNLGLGTCWMGGTFKRASFAKKINVFAGEICPAVKPHWLCPQ
jgi:nitroreductase